MQHPEQPPTDMAQVHSPGNNDESLCGVSIECEGTSIEAVLPDAATGDAPTPGSAEDSHDPNLEAARDGAEILNSPSLGVAKNDLVIDQLKVQISTCVDGKYYDVTGLCYHPCAPSHPTPVLNRCWGSCPSGTTDIGALCMDGAKPKAKPNYNRGIGTIPLLRKLGGSFGPPAAWEPPANTNTRFSMIVASDVQLPWASVGYEGGSFSDIDVSKAENRAFVQTMHQLQDSWTWSWEGTTVTGGGDATNGSLPLAQIEGIAMNGDLTAYFHPWQFDLYRDFWQTRADWSENENIKFNVWPGLGNHDTGNNVNSGWFFGREATWSLMGKRGGAQRALGWMRSLAGGFSNGNEKVMPSFGGCDSYDLGSAAYGWRIGGIRFLQLQNYPSFEGSKAQLNGVDEMYSVLGSLEFLRKEVQAAKEIGLYLVLNFHDLGQHFRNGGNYDDPEREHEWTTFAEIVQDSTVIGVFAGHIHSSGGHLDRNSYVGTLTNKWGERIPYFRSYGASKHRYLITEYDVQRCYWRVGRVDVSVPDDRSEIASYENTYNKLNKKFWEARLPGCSETAEGACQQGQCGSTCGGCGTDGECVRGTCRYYTPFASEVAGKTPANPVRVGSGMRCQAKWCGEVSLQTYSNVYLDTSATAYKTDFVSDDWWEKDWHLAFCEKGTVASQIHCKGQHCDDVALSCLPVAAPAELQDTNRDDFWRSDWFSDEEGTMTCPAGYAMVGVECKERSLGGICPIHTICKGHYCDIKRIYCAPMLNVPYLQPASTATILTGVMGPMVSLSAAPGVRDGEMVNVYKPGDEPTTVETVDGVKDGHEFGIVEISVLMGVIVVATMVGIVLAAKGKCTAITSRMVCCQRSL